MGRIQTDSRHYRHGEWLGRMEWVTEIIMKLFILAFMTGLISNPITMCAAVLLMIFVWVALAPFFNESNDRMRLSAGELRNDHLIRAAIDVNSSN